MHTPKYTFPLNIYNYEKYVTMMVNLRYSYYLQFKYFDTLKTN